MTHTVIIRRHRRRLPEPVIVPVPEPLPVFWSEEDALDALGIGATTLAEWRRDGLPYFKRGRVVLFIADDVIGWIRSQYPDAGTRRVAS